MTSIMKPKKILICIAVYDTEENCRFRYTEETFWSLSDNIDPRNTDVVFINNASCDETTEFLNTRASSVFHVISLENNIGTAEAINVGIEKYAKEGDFIIKMDNDCVVYRRDWPNVMKACLESDPSIGVLGLKRKDLPNSPEHEQYPTTLQFANREHGQPWHVIEECSDIIGTCQMFSPKLIEKVGYLYQPGLYGYDDVLMCERSRLAGFRNAFYPSIEIDHIDTGGDAYTEYKKRYAGTQIPAFNKAIEGYQSGEKSIYYNPFESQ